MPNSINLKSLVRIDTRRIEKRTGKQEQEVRYYISDLDASAEAFNKIIRSHWQIENSLHWSLDVSFNEDYSRKRAGNSAENYSFLLKIALNLLKNEHTCKRSINGKRLKAGWDYKYLSKILNI